MALAFRTLLLISQAADQFDVGAQRLDRVGKVWDERALRGSGGHARQRGIQRRGGGAEEYFAAGRQVIRWRHKSVSCGVNDW